jgi:hypothetical protein
MTGSVFQALADRVTALEADNGRLREVLKDIIDPIRVMRRDAEVEGTSISGLACAMANDLGFVQSLARAALQEDPHTMTRLAMPSTRTQ